MPDFERFDPNNDSLGDAPREWMNEPTAEGKRCPCCDKPDRIYENRTITSVMANLLVAICLRSESNPDAPGEVGGEYHHWPREGA